MFLHIFLAEWVLITFESYPSLCQTKNPIHKKIIPRSHNLGYPIRSQENFCGRKKSSRFGWLERAWSPHLKKSSMLGYNKNPLLTYITTTPPSFVCWWDFTHHERPMIQFIIFHQVSHSCWEHHSYIYIYVYIYIFIIVSMSIVIHENV